MPDVFLRILHIRCHKYDIYLLWPVLQNIKHMTLVMNGDEESLVKIVVATIFAQRVLNSTWGRLKARPNFWQARPTVGV